MKNARINSLLIVQLALLIFWSCTVEEPLVSPVINTSQVTNITAYSASCGGNITSDGGTPITSRGVVWDSIPDPDINRNAGFTEDSIGLGSFTSIMINLLPSTQYYVKAYATNIVGISYGTEGQFITLASTSLPAITTSSISGITNSSAVSGGNISSDGGNPVTARGVCWSTAANPTISDFVVSSGSGIGNFISNITGLNANSTYHVRAFATNISGTAYGNDLQFTTGMSITPPIVSTTSVTSITAISANSGGNVTSDGGAAVTARGVCWSTSANPTTANNLTSNGVGTGSYSSALNGLVANTNYHVRAYATNYAGTSYGNDLQFTTGTNVMPPTIITTSVSGITSTSATSGGNVTSDGGSVVTARGVCWSTSANPTTANSLTTNGSGIGTFTSNLTGLNSNSTYYIRAYATNNAGTAYGNEIQFITSSGGCPPSVTDFNGNIYSTIQIGAQCWCQENLKVRNYNNGVPILDGTTAWSSLTIGARCWYNNDSANNASTYGVLYNWYAVNNGILCPVGWHVPSDAEFQILEISLGMSTVEANATGFRGTNEGGQLKETGTSHWTSPNTGATNSSGFTALPAGWRSASSQYLAIGIAGYWWTSTSFSSTRAWYRLLSYNDSRVYRADFQVGSGLSVRCLKD